MRKKVTFLVGLMGAGKSYLGRQMGGHFLDDICQTCGTGWLKESLTHQTVIADPSLCRPENRFFAEKMVRKYHPECEVEWIFFENDLEKCWRNVQNRNDGRIISKHSIEHLSKAYKIPDGVQTVKVFSGEHVSSNRKS